MKVKTSPNYSSLELAKGILSTGCDWDMARGTYLLAVLLEELGRVHAVGDGASNEGEPVEDHGRLVGVLEEDLVGDIENDGQENEAGEGDGDLNTDALGQELLDKGIAPQILNETHGGDDVGALC
jgi:hypothetical protein